MGFFGKDKIISRQHTLMATHAWTYSNFYKYYINILDSNKGGFDKDGISFTEYKKISSSDKIEVFFHPSQKNLITELHGLEIIDKHPSIFPPKIYVFSTEQDRKHINKRFYILFPTEKKVMQGHTQVIADHLTFLINSNNRDDTKPVKSHMTTYIPVVTLDETLVGVKNKIDFFLPKKFELDDDFLEREYLNRIKSVPHKKFIMEILSKPAQSGGTTHKKALEPVQRTSTKRTFASTKLQRLLNKYFIEDLQVFRIGDDFTVFLECDVPEMEESSSQSSFMTDEPSIASSFTFVSTGHTRRDQEKKIIEIMTEWDDYYQHR